MICMWCTIQHSLPYAHYSIYFIWLKYQPSHWSLMTTMLVMHLSRFSDFQKLSYCCLIVVCAMLTRFRRVLSLCLRATLSYKLLMSRFSLKMHSIFGWSHWHTPRFSLIDSPVICPFMDDQKPWTTGQQVLQDNAKTLPVTLKLRPSLGLTGSHSPDCQATRNSPERCLCIPVCETALMILKVPVPFMYMHTYTYTYTYMCMCMCTCICICICICKCICLCICICICVRVCVRMCMSVCLHVHAYVYRHVYAYVCTHVYI